jgi:hypothetical protein
VAPGVPPCLVLHTGKGTAVVRGLVSSRRGSEASGTNPPFRPGACATTYDLPADSGLGCKGPERIFDGAGALKPWKASSATNEPRNAWPSFRLDPQWSGYGPILPQRGLSAATKLEDWIDYAIRRDCAPFSLAQFDNLAQKTRLSRLVVQGTSRKPETGRTPRTRKTKSDTPCHKAGES